eukprot:XP_014025295.1 PREDICTED: uncharacterized protein LOC106584461 isoform X3 [Salmo salar]
MFKIQLLRVFLNERLTAAAEEIFGVVEKTVAEYQEEVVRLQRLLDIVLQPEPDITLKLHRAGMAKGVRVTLTLGTSSSVLSLSLKRRFPLSSSTVSRSGAPVWDRTQSPYRLKRKRRNSEPLRRKSIFMGLRLILKTPYSLLAV